MYLLDNSINDTKEFLLQEINKLIEFKDYMFLDKESTQTFTLFLGFRYDEDAYSLIKKDAHIRIPRTQGEIVTVRLEPTELF